MHKLPGTLPIPNTEESMYAFLGPIFSIKLAASDKERDKFSCKCKPIAISELTQELNRENNLSKSEGNIEPKVSTI